MSKINRKKLLLFTCMIALVSASNNCKEDTFDVYYEILSEQEDAFAKYSNGLIYIGNEDFINSLKNTNENDILVIDLRDGENPEFVVLDSYRITDKKQREEIIEALCTYESMYPTDWDRTSATMELEWQLHNVSYNLGYKKDKTKDVNFDNNDGKFYENDVLKFILN